TLNGAAFVGIESLTGGTDNDTFKLNNGRAVTGKINGGTGTGTDTLDYSAWSSAVTVNVQSQTATAVGGFSSLEKLVGGRTTGDHLIGANAATTWQITNSNAGKVGALAFSAFENLVGGSSPDVFKFSNGKALSGSLNGGAGSNTLDYSAYTTGVTVN